MGVALIVGGKSEFEYVTALLDQGHGWALLSQHDVRVVDARGDGNIPDLVEKHVRMGERVIVLFDSDALARAHEQATVIRRDDVTTFALPVDFEGVFDAKIVAKALADLQHQAGTDDLLAALRSRRPYEAIRDCAMPALDVRPLDKAALASALATASERYWYIPKELASVFEEIGRQIELRPDPPADLRRWPSSTKEIDAVGCLYVGHHVSNERIAYWDFERKEAGNIDLPDRFEGRISACRRGTRFVLRKFERQGAGFPARTWVYTYDLKNGALEEVARFSIKGSGHELVALEDGNHVEIAVQDGQSDFGVRCLIDGTKQENIPSPPAARMYAPKTSRSGYLTASGPIPLRVTSKSKGEVAVFPHMYGQGYAWSPDGRFLAFFARRWDPPPDFLWIYDCREDKVHRIAAGEHFMPIYWGA